MTDVQTEKPKKPRVAVANHEYLDANGNVLENREDITEAVGYRYTLLANKATFDWYWSQANDDERRMHALMGVKTLATNMTSQARNNEKGAGTPDEQMELLRNRFALVRTGQWLPEREGGAPVAKIDKQALAKAITDVLVNKGKITEADRDATYAAKLQQVTEDAAYLRKSRQVPEVAIAYAAIVGRQAATVDDL